MKVSDAVLAGIGASLPSKDAPANATEKFSCPTTNGSFCLGPSLTMPIMIKCENNVPNPVNCIQQAASRPPFDNIYAPCWQSSPQAGDASCSKSCTVYPTTGEPFPVPGECPASPPQKSGAPYPPTPHFAQIGGLNLNTSSYRNSTSAAGSYAMPLLPRPTAHSYMHSVPIPSPSSAASAASPLSSTALFTSSKSAPPVPGLFNGNHAVPTPHPAPSSPASVRPSILYPSSNSLRHHASHPAPSSLHPPPPPKPTEPIKRPTADLDSLPKASLPPYVTTVTLTSGTTTQMHTVFSSNCDSGTTGIGPGTESSYSVVPVTETATASPSVPLWPEAPGSGKVTLTPEPTDPLTVPCTSATDVVSSEAQPSDTSGWIASAKPTLKRGGGVSTSSSNSAGFTQVTGIHSAEEEQNSGAPSLIQRSLFWIAATLVLAVVWPC